MPTPPELSDKPRKQPCNPFVVYLVTEILNCTCMPFILCLSWPVEIPAVTTERSSSREWRSIEKRVSFGVGI